MKIGKTKGVMVSRMAMIIVPLIMLPNRRTARASVRENSLMMLNGSMMSVGFDVGLEVAAQPLLLDAEQRHGDEDAERQRRGRRERPGRRLVAGNDGAQAGQGDEEEERAEKAHVFLRIAKADILDLLFDAGNDDLQKVLPAGDVRRSVESLRVTSHEPTASTSIKAHVKTIVPFSLTNPYCQKTMSSGLRRMTASGSRWSLLSGRRASATSRRGAPRQSPAGTRPAVASFRRETK